MAHILSERQEIASLLETRLNKETRQRLGSIYTPPDFAQILVSWAIQKPDHKVLDMGVGEGVFSFAAYRRLVELGACAPSAQAQIYGAEIDPSTYARFLELSRNLGVRFPGLQQVDFFDANFPSVDAVIGNPPYVRRIYLENIDQIRQKVFTKNREVDRNSISRLADLYVYFLLYASTFLKPEGRLGIITADPWLNVEYGDGFKKFLLQNFEIESLISLDRRVFSNAQVKPVLILATRKERVDLEKYVRFIRVKNNLPVRALQKVWHQQYPKSGNIVRSHIKGRDLKYHTPWGVYLKTPEIYNKLASHSMMVPLDRLANTRIGIQTLAKDFFVLTSEQAKSAKIENEYLSPLAQSSRYFDSPVIEAGTEPQFYILYCSKNKDDLHGTHVLKYILQGESRKVTVRGKGTTVIGYHNKERIKKSGRTPWYNLKTHLDRRGRASILIPRLLYRTYTVLWNQAKFVPGELFIEFLPLSLSKIRLTVYLAILTSSITEIMLRFHAQVYGGGTYNINPGQIKNVPILNVHLLTTSQKAKLAQAYMTYLRTPSYDRTEIDGIICEILGFDGDECHQVNNALKDLQQIAINAKRKHLGNP